MCEQECNDLCVFNTVFIVLTGEIRSKEYMLRTTGYAGLANFVGKSAFHIFRAASSTGPQWHIT